MKKNLGRSPTRPKWACIANKDRHVDHQKKDNGQATAIGWLFTDLEDLGVSIVGKAELAARLNLAENWRQDFIFWARAGASIGLAHIYEGPKAERREREARIRETMFDHGFSAKAGEAYVRLISHPTIMTQAYARGVVNLEQMQTVEKRSVLKKIGDLLTGRAKLVGGHTARMAEWKLIGEAMKRDPNGPAAKAFGQAFGDHNAGDGRHTAVGVAASLGGHMAIDGLAEHTMLGHDDDGQEHAMRISRASQEADDFVQQAADDWRDRNMEETMESMRSFGENDSFEDFGSSTASSFPTDDFGSGSMSGSGSFGMD
jgi:hypothetical protein